MLSDAEVAAALQAEEYRNAAAAILKADGVEDVTCLQQSPPVATGSLIRPALEVSDPNPDILSLFQSYNYSFFQGKLAGVEVRWSSRMTLCAGLCIYQRGGYCSIRLSEPLLRYRPREDTVNTLLHECIHAYLFVTHNSRDRDGHGDNFKFHMDRINREAGTNITIFHSFHDEVDVYRTHVWRCTGSCRNQPPYFGYVKRAMNRPPGPRDPWWPRHAASCGGTYEKISEPEKKPKPSRKAKADAIKAEVPKRTVGALDKYLKRLSAIDDTSEKATKLGGTTDRQSDEEVLDLSALPAGRPSKIKQHEGADDEEVLDISARDTKRTHGDASTASGSTARAGTMTPAQAAAAAAIARLRGAAGATGGDSGKAEPLPELAGEKRRAPHTHEIRTTHEAPLMDAIGDDDDIDAIAIAMGEPFEVLDDDEDEATPSNSISEGAARTATGHAIDKRARSYEPTGDRAAAAEPHAPGRPAMPGAAGFVAVDELPDTEELPDNDELFAAITARAEADYRPAVAQTVRDTHDAVHHETDDSGGRLPKLGSTPATLPKAARPAAAAAREDAGVVDLTLDDDD